MPTTARWRIIASVLIGAALAILDQCDWLRISRTSISASKWRCVVPKTDGAECDVLIRRKKTETFEAMVIRAAGMVSEGYHPPPKALPPSFEDQLVKARHKTARRQFDELPAPTSPKQSH